MKLNYSLGLLCCVLLSLLVFSESSVMDSVAAAGIQRFLGASKAGALLLEPVADRALHGKAGTRGCNKGGGGGPSSSTAAPVTA